jgi:2-dehydro-3-deoxyphosphogluconate aldolase/(4S)-4-hydroxy-2-oxoglutarate aldolase
MNEIIQKLGRIGIIPVVVIEDASSAVPLGQALISGGLPCAEITFRTPAAADAIREINAAYPEILVGAGTVLTIDQVELAIASGARFIVTPGFDAQVVDWCLANDIPVTPGVMTPTDINQALSRKLAVLKFFPAEAAGGIKTLKAVGGPYAGVKFIPTGGITIDNLAEYLSLPMVHACGGSFMVKQQIIAGGDFQTITRLAQAAVDVVKSVRG